MFKCFIINLKIEIFVFLKLKIYLPIQTEVYKKITLIYDNLKEFYSFYKKLTIPKFLLIKVVTY